MRDAGLAPPARDRDRAASPGREIARGAATVLLLLLAHLVVWRVG
jgi:hypothetical protein